jgi:DNA-binding NtrC family response regulator
MRNDTILVADSDTAVAACIADALAAEGYTVYCHPGIHLTIDAVKRVQPDLVIIEHWHAHPEAMLLLSQLNQCDATKSIAVIVSTTEPWMLRELAAPLAQCGYAMLLKPFDLDQLLASVAGALDDRWRRQAAREPEHAYA